MTFYGIIRFIKGDLFKKTFYFLFKGSKENGQRALGSAKERLGVTMGHR